MERSSSVLALVAALRHVIAEARHFNETSRPNYNLYLLANVREFVIGMGIVQLAVALVVVGRLNFRRLVRRPAADLFSMGVFCTLVVLWLLGINRGEVTRLWLSWPCSSRWWRPTDVRHGPRFRSLTLFLQPRSPIYRDRAPHGGVPDPWTLGAGSEPLRAVNAGAGDDHRCLLRWVPGHALVSQESS
jgi:hypothetical protein